MMGGDVGREVELERGRDGLRKSGTRLAAGLTAAGALLALLGAEEGALTRILRNDVRYRSRSTVMPGPNALGKVAEAR